MEKNPTREKREREIINQAIESKDVKFLCKHHFDEDISLLEEDLIRRIAFEEQHQLSICAMTRWGKSYCVSRGVALFLLLNSNKRIAFIGPQKEQATILRDYMSEIILKCPALLDITEIESTGILRLKKEASKSRQTFKNGCEYRVFTAHGEADSLMGFGLGSNGGILVKDEACLISDDANAKITRMLGDNPDKSMVIELLNPWTRDNKAFEHWNDPDFVHIHIDWQMALEDGRTTQAFIDRQRKDLTPLEFTVLYESKFPAESEDSVFNLDKIKLAVIKGKITTGSIITSCDVADKGKDRTVIMRGRRNIGYSVNNIYSEAKSENTVVAGRLNNLITEDKEDGQQIVNNIDIIGLGTGVVSMVQEFARDIDNVTVNGCHFGEKPILDDKRFLNRKAENYFRLKELFDEKLISIPEHRELIKQLIQMQWEFTSTGKIKIIDPEKPDDYADALVYFIWYAKPQYKPHIAV